MIPSSVGAVVGFLLLVAPGVAWELFSGRFRSAVKESALTELSRIALASIVATSLSGLVLRDQWFDLVLSDEALAAPEGTLSRNLLTMSFLTALVAFGLVLAVWLLCWLFTWRKAGRVRRGRTWRQVFDSVKPAKTERPVAAVELMDGSVWGGIVQMFDDDPEDSGRWIALKGPLRRKRAGSNYSPVDDRWKYVLVPESDIRTIRVAYPNDSKKDSDASSADSD